MENNTNDITPSVQSASSFEIRDAGGTKKGYKKTKLGWIPEEWEIISLSELSSRIGDGIHSTPKYDDNGEFYFVNGNNLINGKIVIDEKTKKTSKEEFKTHKRPIDSTSTIFLSINGTIGNISFYNNENIVLGKSVAYINCTSGINKLFLFYSLQGERIKNYFENELTGSTIRNLSLKSIRSTPIFTPPLPEQQKIAQILSTWDKGIIKLEQLISQKQLLKKGLMQQLLTGKKRFAGFTDEWKEVKLGEIGSFTKGKGISKAELVDEGVPAIRYGELYTNHHFVIKNFTSFISKETSKDCQRLEKGDLLFSGSGEKQFEIGKSAVFNSQVEAYAGGDIVIFKTKKANPIFLSYYLNSSLGIRQRGMYAQGHSVVHIYSRDLAKIKLSLPNLEEQDRIVTVFESLDQQIKQLQNQLTSLQKQKKGLMQKLLTGEVRVKLEI